MNPEIVDMLGNKELLKLHKTAFLCSHRIPAGAVLTCYDRAIAERDAGRCVISGFHSRIEKDVLHYLLKGTQPIITFIVSSSHSSTYLNVGLCRLFAAA